MPNRFEGNYRDTVKEEIKNSYKYGKLIPFVGAGLSKNIDGFPDWDEFIAILRKDLVDKNIIEQYSIGFDSLRSPFEKTEFYVREIERTAVNNGFALDPERLEADYQRGKDALLRKIKNILDPDVNEKAKYDKEKWKVHDQLTMMFGKIYTTNWDLVLESSCGKSPTENDCIIKYHGDLKDKFKGMVACETDYMNRMSKDTCLDIKFKSDLLQKDFIFLGYSFRDPNIKFNLYQLREVINDARSSCDKELDEKKIFWIINEIHDTTNLTLLNSMFSNIRIYLLFDDDKKNKIKAGCKNKGFDGLYKNRKGVIKCFNCVDKKLRQSLETKCPYQKEYNDATRDQMIDFLLELDEFKKRT